MMFRLLLDLPQEAIWEVPEYARGAPNALTSFWGVPLGMFGGFCGWAWMKGTMVTRGAVMEKAGWGPYHVIKGTVGGLLIGLFGAMVPETLFWAEHETQTILDGGETPLPHVWPARRRVCLGDLDASRHWRSRRHPLRDAGRR